MDRAAIPKAGGSVGQLYPAKAASFSCSFSPYVSNAPWILPQYLPNTW